MDVTDLKVLVVDDVRDAADTLAALLRLQLHCNVATAYDGAAAVAAAVDFVPDAVITDFTMPGSNGLETARQILGVMSRMPPLMLLMTANPTVAEDLDAIGDVFDHAFAKPVDVERLVRLLQRHAGPGGPRAPRGRGLDVFEVLTDAVRQVVPLVKARGLTYSFDCTGPRLNLRSRATGLGRGMDRVLRGVVDVVQRGFISITGEVQAVAGGAFTTTINVAGTGRLCSDAEIDAMLRRLALRPTVRDTGVLPGTAHGTCLETGATITFNMKRSEGVLLRWRLQTPAPDSLAVEPGPQAGGSLAWIVDASGEGVAGLVGRLLRLGWRVVRLDSCAQALQWLGRPAGEDESSSPGPVAAPSLIVVLEGDATAAPLQQRLRAAAGARVQIVHAFSGELAGRTRPAGAPATATHSFPFSPAELEAFTRNALRLRPPAIGGGGDPDGSRVPAGTADAQAAGAAASAASAAADGDDRNPRPSVLLVDDNEVNRIVGRALVETLGYDVETCSDGLDAIVQCERQTPDIVLMDIEMAVLDGYEATRRLRRLQAVGRMPRFNIIACTAQPRDAQRADEAGLDGHLAKPLERSRLAVELGRHGGATPPV